MDNTSPTIDEVRQWGFDEDMHFMEQEMIGSRVTQIVNICVN
jgi:hypothetical protein